MVIIHILIGVVQAILRAMTSAFLLFFSSLFTTLIVLALLGLAAFGLSGYVGLRLSKRNRSPRA